MERDLKHAPWRFKPQGTLNFFYNLSTLKQISSSTATMFPDWGKQGDGSCADNAPCRLLLHIVPPPNWFHPLFLFAGDICNCSVVGSASAAECNVTTGQCPCLDGYTGLRCEICAQGFYQEPNSQQCRPCGCSPSGSSTTQCDQ